MYKTLKIEEELHEQIKNFCSENNVFLQDWTEFVLSHGMENNLVNDALYFIKKIQYMNIAQGPFSLSLRSEFDGLVCNTQSITYAHNKQQVEDLFIKFKYENLKDFQEKIHDMYLNFITADTIIPVPTKYESVVFASSDKMQDQDIDNAISQICGFYTVDKIPEYILMHKTTHNLLCKQEQYKHLQDNTIMAFVTPIQGTKNGFCYEIPVYVTDDKRLLDKFYIVFEKPTLHYSNSDCVYNEIRAFTRSPKNALLVNIEYSFKEQSYIKDLSKDLSCFEIFEADDDMQQCDFRFRHDITDLRITSEIRRNLTRNLLFSLKENQMKIQIEKLKDIISKSTTSTLFCSFDIAEKILQSDIVEILDEDRIGKCFTIGQVNKTKIITMPTQDGDFCFHYSGDIELYLSKIEIENDIEYKKMKLKSQWMLPPGVSYVIEEQKQKIIDTVSTEEFKLIKKKWKAVLDNALQCDTPDWCYELTENMYKRCYTDQVYIQPITYEKTEKTDNILNAIEMMKVLKDIKNDVIVSISPGDITTFNKSVTLNVSLQSDSNYLKNKINNLLKYFAEGILDKCNSNISKTITIYDIGKSVISSEGYDTTITVYGRYSID